jgi:putative copper resistance protein D
LANTRFGHVWSARLVLFVLLALCLFARRSDDRPLSARGVATAFLAAALLGALAPAGHAGTNSGTAGSIHLAGDIIHAVAAGAWVGGLIPLALLFAAARRGAEPTNLAPVHETTRRFSMLGLVSVLSLLATGIVSTVFLVGSVPALFGTTYGRLLSAKVVLFLAMVGIAAVNRVTLTPQLAGTHAAAALRQLQRNSLFEAALGLVAIAIVGALGTVPPLRH